MVYNTLMNQPTNKQIIEAGKILDNASIPGYNRLYLDEDGQVHKIVITSRQCGKTYRLNQLNAPCGKPRFPTGSGRTCKSGR